MSTWAATEATPGTHPNLSAFIPFIRGERRRGHGPGREALLPPRQVPDTRTAAWAAGGFLITANEGDERQ